MMRISEIFNSVEGEGINSGLPTTFVRLQGCRTHCDFCDSRHTWDTEAGYTLSIDEVVSKVKSLTMPGNIVSITGGDPMLQRKEVEPLTKALINEGFLVNLEHTGLFKQSIRNELDFLCSLNFVSFDIKPPSSGIVLDKIVEGVTFIMWYRYTFSIKCVVMCPEDLKFLEEVVFPFKDPRTVLTLMPCNSKDRYDTVPLIVKDIVDFLRNTKHKNIRLGSQLHKTYGLR
jgi:7-carboxy-7-deazaguanine synthase